MAGAGATAFPRWRASLPRRGCGRKAWQGGGVNGTHGGRSREGGSAPARGGPPVRGTARPVGGHRRTFIRGLLGVPAPPDFSARHIFRVSFGIWLSCRARSVGPDGIAAIGRGIAAIGRREPRRAAGRGSGRGKRATARGRRQEGAGRERERAGEVGRKGRNGRNPLWKISQHHDIIRLSVSIENMSSCFVPHLQTIRKNFWKLFFPCAHDSMCYRGKGTEPCENAARIETLICSLFL